MASRFLAIVTGLAAMTAAGGAAACGQMSHVEPAKPGAMVVVRGYGYGFEGGDRPLQLIWAGTRSVVAVARIDATGAFEIAIPAPEAPGEHELIAMEGEADPAPASVTVTVLPIGV